MSAQTHLPTFYVLQKFSMTANRYSIQAADQAGTPGRIMAVAQQKRMAFKEQVTFYEDESKTRPVFSFAARKRIDLNAGYDITDESGAQIGFFRKDFGASLLRSTFHVEGPGYTGTGQERSPLVAGVRRFVDIPFLPIHFDFVDPAGQSLLIGGAAGEHARPLHGPRARPAGRLPRRRRPRGRPRRPDAALSVPRAPGADPDDTLRPALGDCRPCASTWAPTTPGSTSRHT